MYNMSFIIAFVIANWKLGLIELYIFWFGLKWESTHDWMYGSIIYIC